jgi:hypothetical protein
LVENHLAEKSANLPSSFASLEVVIFLAIDNAAHELLSMQVFAGTETHSVHVVGGHGGKNLLTRSLAVLFTKLRIGIDDLVDELADGWRSAGGGHYRRTLLKFSVRFLKVRALKGGGKPCGLSVGDLNGESDSPQDKARGCTVESSPGRLGLIFCFSPSIWPILRR